MAIQQINLGTAPTGVGGDTNRSAYTKINQNFTDTTNAASKLVTASPADTTPDRVMKVGDFGLGADAPTISPTLNTETLDTAPTQISSWFQTWAVLHVKNQDYNGLNKPNWTELMFGRNGAMGLMVRYSYNGVVISSTFYGTHNTAVDANGFIKRASPIVKLFADKIELNDEATQQDITFEKLGVGDYLVKGSTGFAQEGWYIEMPKDANGNVLVAVIYEQLDNNDISVKTYAKMFDEETGDIVANTAKPRDIPSTRWIDLRLQALPQTTPLSKDETVATNAE